jgi:hypothetical protein
MLAWAGSISLETRAVCAATNDLCLYEGCA